MLTLYHAPQSRSSAMIWLLEEVGRPYTIRPVSIFRPLTGEGQGDAANPHPDKRVPALDDDGVLVTEMVAIALYLAERFPDVDLAPAVGDPARGAFLTWIAWYACELQPALFAALGRELDAAPHKKRSYDLVVQRIETTLAIGPYLMGDRFTLVDFLASSALNFGRAVFPPSEALDAYLERCRSRPAAVRGFALDNASGLQTPA